MSESDPKTSGYFSKSQAQYHDELMNPAPANFDTKPAQMQTPPKKPIGSTPTYRTRNRSAK